VSILTMINMVIIMTPPSN